jgi:hypothetical protein
MRTSIGRTERHKARGAAVLSVVGVVLGLAHHGFAQFTAAEVAQRPRWEAFLREAAILAQMQLRFEQGVTEPWKLTLRQGDVLASALWKDPSGERGGFWEGWKYEIAAYELDKLLGLNMVPPTVEREFSGRAGSCQLWIEGASLYRDLAAARQDLSTFKSDRWLKAGYAAQFFDNLIGNEDRHMGNVLVTADARAILIDHSRTFRTSERFVKAIPFSDKNAAPDSLMRKLPRALVQRTFALTEGDLREAVGDLLTDAELKAVMARLRLLSLEVRRIIADFGEDDVLY